MFYVCSLCGDVYFFVNVSFAAYLDQDSQCVSMGPSWLNKYINTFLKSLFHTFLIHLKVLFFPIFFFGKCIDIIEYT